MKDKRYLVKLSVMFPFIEGKRFDNLYFIYTLLPAICKKYCPLGIEVDEGKFDYTDNPPAFIAIGHILYLNSKTLTEGVVQNIRDELCNFSDIEPIFQINKISIVSSL